MMTMLERAAKALESAHLQSSKASGNPINGGEDYSLMARSVLDAVRLDDWSDGSPVENLWASTDLLKHEMDRFNDVIDAILNEKPHD